MIAEPLLLLLLPTGPGLQLEAGTRRPCRCRRVDAVATELSDLGIGLDLCLFEDLDTDEEGPRHVSATHYEIIVIVIGGVRLETS